VKVLIDELTIWQFDTFHRSGKYEILYKNNFVTISLSPIRKSKIRFLQWRTWGHFSEGKIRVFLEDFHGLTVNRTDLA
jgi:hypothetical protein